MAAHRLEPLNKCRGFGRVHESDKRHATYLLCQADKVPSILKLKPFFSKLVVYPEPNKVSLFQWSFAPKLVLNHRIAVRFSGLTQNIPVQLSWVCDTRVMLLKFKVLNVRLQTWKTLIANLWPLTHSTCGYPEKSQGFVALQGGE